MRNDDLCGGQLAAEYLIGLGHRRIAFISGPERATPSQLRLQGCRKALQQAGLSIPSHWVVQGTGLPEAGERAARLLMRHTPPPTAIFCYNDMTAMGALHEVKRNGFAVPRDVSIIGYDDIAAAAYLDPPLTTVAQAKYTLGHRAMEMTLDLIRGQETAHDVLLRPELTVRSSCGPPRE
ncbi:MAG: substrate-binding domain-containing protein [Anaerolineae bacterium]|nr:substrate-binding domain-containing protein [Anaerolineae bacterium]